MIPRHRPWEEAQAITIGLRPIAPEAWLEGGEVDPAARKDPLFKERRALVWAETDGSHAAQCEALDLFSAALKVTPETQGLPPLYAAARCVADDLCLMQRREGEWRLTALSLSAGSFFVARDVIGRSLAELHVPVTGFAERSLARVQRIFDGLRPGLVLERRNWTVLNSDALHAPDAAPIRADIAAIDPADAPSLLHLRVERQTLRRLPATGAVIFTIRVWLSPLASLSADPARLAAFARAWRTADPDLRRYKRFDLYDGLVEDYLHRAGVGRIGSCP